MEKEAGERKAKEEERSAASFTGCPVAVPLFLRARREGRARKEEEKGRRSGR